MVDRLVLCVVGLFGQFAFAGPLNEVVEGELLHAQQFKLESGKLTAISEGKGGNPFAPIGPSTYSRDDSDLVDYREGKSGGSKIWRLTEFRLSDRVDQVAAATTSFYQEGMRNSTECLLVGSAAGKSSLTCVTAAPRACRGAKDFSEKFLAAKNGEQLAKLKLDLHPFSDPTKAGALLPRKERLAACLNSDSCLSRIFGETLIKQPFSSQYDQAVEQELAALKMKEWEKINRKVNLKSNDFDDLSGIAEKLAAGKASPIEVKIARNLVQQCVTKKFVNKADQRDPTAPEDSDAVAR